MHDLSTFKLIERISTLLRSEERKKYAVYGLQPVHGQVLEYLASCNKFSNTPAAVTEYLSLTKGTVSQSIQVLQRKNYIDKVPDPSDRRVVHLLLTETGQEVVDQAKPAELFDKIQQQVAKQHFDNLEQALNFTLISLQKANHSKSFGLCHTCRYFNERGQHYYCELTQLPLAQGDINKICREHTAPDTP